MGVYVRYDPTDNNRVKGWVRCPPETLRAQRKEPHERFAWFDGVPPELSARAGYWDETERTIRVPDEPVATVVILQS